MRLKWLPILFTITAFASNAQESTSSLPEKVLHAEPLYIDLIRDLGARKGEKEWNIGMGMVDRLRFDSYEFLIEYEWAPLNRLGLEVEVPVTLYSNPGRTTSDIPSNRIESLKLAGQYTFFVSPHHNTSLAIGTISELEFSDLNRLSADDPFTGILFNPFFVAAKEWRSGWHTLLYTGPKRTLGLGDHPGSFAWEINSNIHYMIPGTKNFIGIEANKRIQSENFDMILRPQMRVVVKEGLMVGIVPGIPVCKNERRLSSFLRLIWEPKHKMTHEIT